MNLREFAIDTLGKGGYFVTGVKKKQRLDSRKKWRAWWEENRENYT